MITEYTTNMKKEGAYIFDLNGTMINDMEFHIDAWFGILNDELSAGLTREAVKQHMYGKNSELLIRVFGPDRFTQAEMEEISLEKERHYQQAFFPHLQLITGLPRFLQQAADRNMPMAIASAAISFNIDFVIDNLQIRHYFQAIVSADDVTRSKPDPETFLKAARLLNVQPDHCIVFEDAPRGVEAANNAGMQCVVLTTMHGKDAFSQYPNVLDYIADYNNFF